jgi:hypothetical protein
MDKTRVVLCKLPPLMREILRDLVNRQADLEVVDEVDALAGLPAAIEARRAEAVIVALSSEAAASAVCALQTDHPGIMVLSFIDGQHRPVVWSCNGDPQPVEAVETAVVGVLRQCQTAATIPSDSGRQQHADANA